VFVQYTSAFHIVTGIGPFGIGGTSRENNSGAANDSSIRASSLSFGFQMVQISISIAVGLFASALLIYPFARKRSGFYSFY